MAEKVKMTAGFARGATPAKTHWVMHQRCLSDQGCLWGVNLMTIMVSTATGSLPSRYGS
jgi:hypothetical protein